MEKCIECGRVLDEDFDELFYTRDDDGPFCEDCIDEVVEDRAAVQQATIAA